MTVLLNRLLGQPLVKSCKQDEAKLRYEVRPESESGRALPRSFEVPSNRTDEVLGWFSNKFNVGGWVLLPLDQADKNWLTAKKVDLKNVFRSYSDSGNTNIIKLNAKTGVYAFADNEHLEATDEVRFQKAVRYTKLIIENEKSKAAFGV